MLIPDNRAVANARRHGHLPAASNPAWFEAGGNRGQPGLSLGDIARAVARNFLSVLALALIAGFIGFGIGTLLPPKYRAEGLLVIDTQELNIQDLMATRSSRTVEPWGGRSEARILTSDALIRQTVDELALVHDPSFNPTLRPNPLANLIDLAWLPPSLRDVLAKLSPEPITDGRIVPEVVDAIGRNLSADSEERSYAIGIAYTGRDAEGAALFVNSLMARYLANEVEAKRAPVLAAQAELANRVDQLFATLEKTRAEIRRLEATGELLTTGDQTLSSQELADIAAERRELASQRLQIQGELAQIRSALATERYSVPSVARETPRLRALWETESLIRARLAELQVNFGDNHPSIVAARAELADNQTEIAAEVRQIAGGIERELRVLATRDAELAGRIETVQQQASRSAEGRTLLNQLRAEERSQQALFDDYRERYEQTLASEELYSADARIVSPASPPHKPSTPSPKLLALAGLIMGGLAGVAWTIGRQYLHPGVQTLQEVSGISGLPALGGLPRVQSIIGGETVVADHVLSNPKSIVTETVRGILFRLQHPEAGGTPPKVVMITSPMPRDGKSSLVTSLARVAARDGMNVLAIDCDFRKPSLAKSLGVVPRWWLNDYLDGAIEVGDALIQDPRGAAHFMLSKPAVHCNKAFLEQGRLRMLVDESARFYDLILIDTPPILKVVDPLILSQLVDATVMVVSWREVSRKLIREAMGRLTATSTPLAGVVLSRIGGHIPENDVYGGYGDAA